MSQQKRPYALKRHKPHFTGPKLRQNTVFKPTVTLKEAIRMVAEHFNCKETEVIEEILDIGLFETMQEHKLTIPTPDNLPKRVESKSEALPVQKKDTNLSTNKE